MTTDHPVFLCRRIGNQLTFECPYCWTYGGAFGACDVDGTGSYKRRPKRAKPKWHLHGGEAGHRVAHCFPGSPLYLSGYILAEESPPPTSAPPLPGGGDE